MEARSRVIAPYAKKPVTVVVLKLKESAVHVWNNARKRSGRHSSIFVLRRDLIL